MEFPGSDNQIEASERSRLRTWVQVFCMRGSWKSFFYAVRTNSVRTKQRMQCSPSRVVMGCDYRAVEETTSEEFFEKIRVESILDHTLILFELAAC